MATNITREELKAKMDRGEKFVLVDALSAKHYESSHLLGAVNLPYESVDEAETVLPDKALIDAASATSAKAVRCTRTPAERRSRRLPPTRRRPAGNPSATFRGP